MCFVSFCLWALHHSINLSAGSFVGQSREFSPGNEIRPKEILHLFSVPY
jgi:hypothetical protein